MRLFSLKPGALCALGTALLVAAGCGGGGGGGTSLTGGGPGDPPAVGSSKTGTAKFSVDVDSGKVTVTPMSGDPTSRAIFTGTAARFDSSDLLNDTGELTRRKLAVALKNNTGEPIGVAGSGFKVMFGEFTSGIATDLRPRTTVSTLIGSGASGSADGPALSATLSSPHSVLVASNGDVYFSGYNQSIRLLRDGMVSTIATGVGPVTSMIWRLDGNQENIYAASLNTHKIYRINVETRAVTLLAGTGSSGSNDGPGSTARFNLPYSVIDLGTGTAANPTLLVAEGTTGKMRLMVHDGTEYQVSTLGWTTDAPRGMVSLGGGQFVVASAFIRKLAICDITGQRVLLGEGSSGTTDGNGETMRFFEPIGVFAPALLSQGGRTLYVSESSGVIRQLTLRANGNPTSKLDWTSATLAGISQAYGFQDGTGDVAKFLGPVCMATDQSGNILVADSGNQRIRKVTPQLGSFPIEIGGANSGVDKVRLANPTEFVPTDAGPTPYILESMTVPVNEQVQLTPWSLIIPEGVKSFEFIVTIEAETTSSAPPDAVNNPGPTVAPGSSRAIVRTLAGATTSGYANGSVSTATFAGPSAFAYDAQGVLYVADSGNQAVRRITPAGSVTTVAGVPGNSGSADGTGATASFGSVEGVAVNAAGTVIYATDSLNNTIRRIALTSGADASQPFSWNVTTIAGLAGPSANESGLGSVARFNGPWGIALTNGGELLVSESAGKRIRRLQPVGADQSLSTSWVVTLVAGHPNSVSPFAQNVDGIGPAARFGELRGITLASSGELYVADWSNSTIRRVSNVGDTTTFAGGAVGYGDNDFGASAKFDHPTGVAVDRAGYVYVADSINRLVRRVSPAGSVRTVAGTGAEGTNDGPGNVARFRTLKAIAVTNAGDVILGDTRRIRLIERLISSGLTQ